MSDTLVERIDHVPNTRRTCRALIRAGELEVSGEDQAETDLYFDTGQFRFHGPDGFEADYSGLTNYFKAIRAAFGDRSIRRGTVVAEGNYIACGGPESRQVVSGQSRLLCAHCRHSEALAPCSIADVRLAPTTAVE